MRVEDAIEAYLNSQKATLWGRAFDLSEPTSRDEAKALIAEIIAQVAARMLTYP